MLKNRSSVLLSNSSTAAAATMVAPSPPPASPPPAPAPAAAAPLLLLPAPTAARVPPLRFPAAALKRCRASTRDSTVSLAMRRTTRVGRAWPRRCTRAAAWWVVDGWWIRQEGDQVGPVRTPQVGVTQAAGAGGGCCNGSGSGEAVTGAPAAAGAAQARINDVDQRRVP
jgi:hypothetical protein